MSDKARVLYIDDEKDNLVGFKASYSKFYEIETALSGILAANLLSQKQFDVVLVDYKMPGEDGLTLIQGLRNNFPDLAFIVVTAYADIDVVIRALEMHCIFSFVQKPWNHEELKNIIDRAFEMKRVRLENKELKENLIAQNKRLEEALEKEKKLNEYKMTFIRNLSHEVRTPLNGIMGFNSLAKSTGCNAELAELIDLSVHAGEQLIRTFENMTIASEIFSGMTELSPQSFYLNAMIDELINYLTGIDGEFEGRSVELKPFEQIELFQDSEKVRAVFYQLIHNALKFSENTPVRLEVFKDTEVFRVTIEDKGIGIDMARQKKVFDPFFQQDASLSRKFSGNGLGLFIVRSFVSLLQGRLEIDSSQGEGTCFSLELPVSIKK